MSSGVNQLFRNFLNGRGFIEIHTPKLQAAATESGASVFKVSYFKGESFRPILSVVSIADSAVCRRYRLPRPISSTRQADVYRRRHGEGLRNRTW